MKIRGIIVVLCFIVCIEALVSLILLKQNRNYQQQNRQLIIQNDSILSVNLQSAKLLRQDQHKTAVKTK